MCQVSALEVSGSQNSYSSGLATLTVDSGLALSCCQLSAFDTSGHEKFLLLAFLDVNRNSGFGSVMALGFNSRNSEHKM